MTQTSDFRTPEANTPSEAFRRESWRKLQLLLDPLRLPVPLPVERADYARRVA